MPIGTHFLIGFEVVRSIISIAIAIAFIWLVFKLGKLADAYSDKLRAKPQT